MSELAWIRGCRLLGRCQLSETGERHLCCAFSVEKSSTSVFFHFVEPSVRAGIHSFIHSFSTHSQIHHTRCHHWLDFRSPPASRNSYLHLQFSLLELITQPLPSALISIQHSGFRGGRFCADRIMLHSPEAVNKASRAIHYAYPPALFLCFLVMQGITVCTLGNLKASKKIIRKRLLLWLQISVIVTYVSSLFWFSLSQTPSCVCGLV